MNQAFGLDYLDRRAKTAMMAWGITLILWLLWLSIAPDPRPLGAPGWSVNIIRAVTSLTEPEARAITTIILRSFGMGLVGILLVMFLGRVRLKWAAPIALVLAPLLCLASMWINYGYFPVQAQVQIALTSSILGVLFGLTIRHNGIILLAFIIFASGLFYWGTSTGISNDLYLSARHTRMYIMENASTISKGDEGFLQFLKLAFSYAEDNSHGINAVEPNKAAILALGAILGDKKVAEVAKRQIDPKLLPEFTAIRNRVTVEGRGDLVRHFWVSAALTVLSDGRRSMTVGITKELMDTTPGGSGFSFVDLAADQAGNLFAETATANADAARQMQVFIRQAVKNADFFPDITGLPEGLTRDEFQNEYGGLGGNKTRQVVNEINRRLASSRALNYTH